MWEIDHEKFCLEEPNNKMKKVKEGTQKGVEEENDNNIQALITILPYSVCIEILSFFEGAGIPSPENFKSVKESMYPFSCFGYFREDKNRQIFWLWKTFRLYYVSYSMNEMKHCISSSEIETLTLDGFNNERFRNIIRDGKQKNENNGNKRRNGKRGRNQARNDQNKKNQKIKNVKFSPSAFERVKRLRIVVENERGEDSDLILSNFSFPKLEKLEFVNSTFSKTKANYREENMKNLRDVKVLTTRKDYCLNLFFPLNNFSHNKRAVISFIENNERQNWVLDNFNQLAKFEPFFFKKDVIIPIVRACAFDDPLRFFPKNVTSDKDIIEAACVANPSNFAHAHLTLKNDKEFVKRLIKNSNSFGSILKNASEQLCNNKEVVLIAVNKNGSDLRFASTELKENIEVVSAAVKQNGLALEYVPEKFKNNEQIVSLAIQQNGRSLIHANDRFKKNKKFVLLAFKNAKYLSLRDVDNSFINDKDVVLAALKVDGMNLQYAAKVFKEQREYVIVAIRQNARALRFASKDQKKDRELVLEAIKQMGFALNFADKSLSKDRELVLESVKQDPRFYQRIDESFKCDKEILLISVKKFEHALGFAHDSLKKDKEVVLEAVKYFPFALFNADPSLKNDKNFILEAIKVNSAVIYETKKSFRSDKDCIFASYISRKKV